MQPSAQHLSESGLWLYDPLFVLAWLGTMMSQGSFGVMLLLSLRRWRYQGAGSLNRWSRATWSAFVVAGLCYPIFVSLPLSSWLCLSLNLSFFCVWASRAARWAAQE